MLTTVATTSTGLWRFSPAARRIETTLGRRRGLVGDRLQWEWLSVRWYAGHHYAALQLDDTL
ncbi:MAG: hypothetical protein AAB385_12260, partial [Planctomycetota bacterium]